MKPLFTYADYRLFLKDFYEFKKKTTPYFSFRYFAKKVGLNSPNYYKLVMDHQRNLTHKNIKKFSLGLGLSEKEALYFENLVFFNQAKDKNEKEFFEKNILTLKENAERGLLSQDQYAVLSKWYPLVIKELALVQSFCAIPKWIAQKLDHKITPVEAREALELLERLNLITIDPKTKKIHVTTQSLQTPDITYSDAATQYHTQMLDLAKDSLKTQTSQNRCFSALTVAVRKEDLAKAFEKMHAFRNEMDAFFSKAKKYDHVYQLNLNLFRLDCNVED